MHLCTLAHLPGYRPCILRIASLGTHIGEKSVSSQGAFVCPGCRPHIFAQALRGAEGRLYLCPYGSRERVYKGEMSSFSVMSTECGTIPL